MREISTVETNEVRLNSPENYRQIKPETEMTKTEAENTVREKYDDNDKLYRVDDELLPNNEYKVNGYDYKTDGEGRIVSAEGKLQVKDHKDRAEMPDKLDTIGKGDQKDTDDRGHLIADRFNGSGELDNLVPMDQELNRGDYAKLEGTLAEAVNDGADVRLKVEPIYEGNSSRPSEFKVSYSIDGDKDVVVFRNGEN